jgi:hypothetical protein
MIRLAIDDEDFDNDILRGVLRRLPKLEVVRVQDASLSGAADPVVLDWAAREGRLLFTHDVRTMTAHAYARVAAKLPMPGLVAVPQSVPTGAAIDEVVLIAECSIEGEWEGQILHLPL